MLIFEDRTEDRALVLHEPRQAGFDPVWRRVDSGLAAAILLMTACLQAGHTLDSSSTT